MNSTQTFEGRTRKGLTGTWDSRWGDEFNFQAYYKLLSQIRSKLCECSQMHFDRVWCFGTTRQSTEIMRGMVRVVSACVSSDVQLSNFTTESF